MSKTLEAKGGDYGDAWDDGVHDDVHEITVKTNAQGVNVVKFTYVSGSFLVDGRSHGTMSMLKPRPYSFMLDDDEYITFVEGHFGKDLHGNYPFVDADYMTWLKFKTNKSTYHVLEPIPGHEYEGTMFVLGEKDHKIVGFYGKSSTTSLNQLGVHVKPINKS